jgi:hypothetical protein
VAHDKEDDPGHDQEGDDIEPLDDPRNVHPVTRR